jgi:hypothetical protein
LTLGSSPRFDCASQSPAWDGPTPALRTGEPSPDPHAYSPHHSPLEGRYPIECRADRLACPSRSLARHRCTARPAHRHYRFRMVR